ncbi:MAG TPA: hypothetical protein VKS21_13895, partial [Spirochaetota bacterium]|nr:hypothetical protein [Spirochaetota bacterium]
LHQGFPTPADLWSNWGQGRYFRKYTPGFTDPRVVKSNNEQIPWGWRSGAPMQPVHVSGNRWLFYLNNSNLVISNYQSNDLIGIKSKHEGDTFWFRNSSDILFANIKWTHSTRGVARSTSSLVIRGCRVERGDPINGQTPCMASPSGGPQMNQLSVQGDTVATNMVYVNYYCDSPGDDCTAFFNVNGGLVSNCTLRNSFARGIYLSGEAQNIHVTGTVIPNNPVEKESDPVWYWTVADAAAQGYCTTD